MKDKKPVAPNKSSSPKFRTPFVKGNKIWQLADPEKVGRPPKYETPLELWDDVAGYFEWSDDNPKIKNDFRGKDADEVYLVLERPYTWQALYAYLGVKDLEHYKTKTEFSAILTHIQNIIYSQKYTGAAVGLFNANIIARDLGLTDKTELKHDVTEETVEVFKIGGKEIVFGNSKK